MHWAFLQIGNYGFSLNSKSLDIFFPHAVVYVAVWVFLFEFVSENILGFPETKDHSTISSCRFYHFIDYICLLSHGSPILSIIVKLELIGGMWFLKTLFCCFVFTYIAKRIGKNDLVTAIGSIVFALLFPHGYFLQFNWMLIFFWTGFFLRSYSKAYERYRLIVTISSLLIFVLLCDHIAPQVLTYEVLFHHPLQLPRQYITGLSGSLSLIGCTYYVCRWLKEQNRLINNLAEIGTYTLGIYGLQVIVLEKLLTGRVHINNIFFMDWELDFIIAPFVGFISVLLCYALIQILKRSKPLDFLLFGNQY